MRKIGGEIKIKFDEAFGDYAADGSFGSDHLTAWGTINGRAELDYERNKRKNKRRTRTG